MASLPANDFSPAPHEEVLEDFVLIRTADIDVPGDRIRAVDPVWAAALGAMMARDGQDVPIQVCRLPGRNRWTLVAGAHRHAGAVAEDIAYLRAEVVTADRDERRMREVRENLYKSGLDPIERAAHIAEAVAIYKRRAGIDPAADGRSVSVAARWQKAVKNEALDTTATIAVVYGITDQVASDIGFSSRTVESDLKLYRRLSPSIVARLRKARHPSVKIAAELHKLARLEPAAQADTLDALVGDNGWEPVKTVKEAIERTQASSAKPIDAPDQKRLNTVLGTLQRMSASERQALFQSPDFHGLIPVEAQRLLAPMRRDPVVAAPAPDRAAISEWIDAQLIEDADPAWIVGEVARRFGGAAELADGWEVLSVAGVKATCTTGAVGLLRAWQRLSVKKDQADA